MILKISEKDYMNEEYDIFDDEIDEYEDENYDSEFATIFEKGIRKFLDDLISQSDFLEEKFTSNRSLLSHFNKHCLGHSGDKRSTRGKIYYDFNDNSKYSTYEKNLTQKIKDTKYAIGSLYDYDTILDYMRKLFEGDITVVFSNSCGINNNGIISISFHSFASNVTKNYRRGNTIDLCIKNASGRTISLYPIDAYDVENRLNNTLKRYCGLDHNFNFNH